MDKTPIKLQRPSKNCTGSVFEYSLCVLKGDGPVFEWSFNFYHSIYGLNFNSKTSLDYFIHEITFFYI
jgi:hypothetical protein